MLDDALHDAILARRIAAFEDDEYLAVFRNDVALEFHEFDLKAVELVLVFLVRKLRRQFGRLFRRFRFPCFRHCSWPPKRGPAKPRPPPFRRKEALPPQALSHAALLPAGLDRRGMLCHELAML